jgi:hypothetical protein
LAQEAEQRSRPASRMYSGFRAVKAWANALLKKGVFQAPFLFEF